ncbi:MAG: extensin family protein [Rhodobacteraceae bacterium]|nr:extensin family protein [Paracoccaceae bacterium]
MATRDLLRKVHRGACGPFGTVLAPNVGSHHKNHFQMDTARYCGGPFCR